MKIVVLTGAGISAESGLATFRAVDGLWNDHRIEDVASPEGFERNPALVHAFYDMRRREALLAQPNPAHRALAALEAIAGVDVVIVTQNVDDLHERAGSSNVIHIHGRLGSAWCTSCNERHPWIDDLATLPPCPSCGAQTLRPDIVWFGEAVYGYDEIADAMVGCDEFWVIGTSGNVAPASTLVYEAQAYGARTVLMNLEDHADSSMFDEVVLGAASLVVPERVRAITLR